MWKAVKAGTREIRVGKAEKGKDNEGKESCRRMGNMG